MPNYSGPCEECGEHLEKFVRQGRRALHLECAVIRMERNHREKADPTSAARQADIERGRIYANEYRQGGGYWYEKWRKGMARYMNQRFPTEHGDPATVLGEPTATRRKPTRRQQADGRYQR